MVYYNENDPDIAAWLQQLVDDRLLPKGYVDTRSITEVKPNDLKGFKQCHFFAGIGGWPLALKLAGIPEDFNIWTGSCPCQPFSVANSRFSKGLDDERNLWCYFFNLIKECSPAVVIGEQVEASIPKGWLDIVKSNLEGEEYAFGCSVLSASLTGTKHLRRRLYWGCIKENLLEDSDGFRFSGWDPMVSEGRSLGWLQESDKEWLSRITSFWSNGRWTEGTRGKALMLEHGTFPLADGVPNFLVKCRGYGKAIVPQLGASFVRSLLTL